MLKVNSRSSANGGSGSTIIARIITTTSGAISARTAFAFGPSRRCICWISAFMERSCLGLGRCRRQAGRWCGSSSTGTSIAGSSPGDGAALAQRGAQLVDVGEHLGDGREQRGRDLAVELGVGVERARQHRRLQHRHLGALGGVADLQRQQVGALRDDARRRHAALVVLQRDRIVGRVHHDQVGLRHRGHHPALGHLAHAGAHLRLHLGVALELLVLLLQLLVAHLQALRVQVALQRHVDQRERGQREQQQAEPAEQHLRRRADRRRQRHRQHAGERVDVAPQVERADRAEDQRERARLHRIDQLRLREQALDADQRIELLEAGRERLEGPGPAAHRDAAGDRDGHHRHAERHDDEEQADRELAHPRRHEGRRLQRRRIEAQALHQQVLQPARNRRRQRDQQARRRPRPRRSGRGRASVRPGPRRGPCRACAARRGGSCLVRSNRP